MDKMTRFLAETVQPPAVTIPNVNSQLVYQFIAALIVLAAGVALLKTTIGKILIVVACVFLVLKVTGHLA